MSAEQYLNPRNDIAFKKIFGSAKNSDILIHFLNDVLNKVVKDEIKSVTLINTVLLPEIEGNKQSILDVLCTDHKGIQYIVEMQVSGSKGFAKRAQYYAAKAYSGQAKQGDDYYNLKEIIFLAILDFTMFPDKKHYKSDHVILDKENHAHDLKDFSFTFIELPKFNKTEPEDLLTYEEKWCYFFKHAGEPDNMHRFLATIKEEGNIIQKAYDVLEAHNWTAEELRNYDRQEKINMDMRAKEAFLIENAEAKGIEIGEARGVEKGIEIGREEGLKEGLKEGMEIGEARGIEKGAEKNRKEMVLSSLASGLDKEMIAKITNLSLKEINAIQTASLH